MSCWILSLRPILFGINAATDNFGVLAIKPLKPDETMTIEQERVLHSFASLAALAASRVRSVKKQA